MTQIAIHTENLSKDFKSVCALDNLSFNVEQGTIFGFLGPNGAGKTTTIRLLLGLLEPSKGHAMVLGFDSQSQGEQIRENCGAVLEHTGLYERLTAQDNLEFYARVWNIPQAERESRIKELLSHMDLWERRKETVSGWSHGMKQKLALIRALLHRPALLFLDEPTSGLDPIAAAALRDDLMSLVARQGTSVFLTTHNLSEAEKLCHQVAVICKGKLLAVGSPNQLHITEPRLLVKGKGFTEAVLNKLRQHPEVTSIALQEDALVVHLKSATSTASLVNILVTNGAEIEELIKQEAGLEEAFLALVEENSR
jgi:ABC-2 type transport system ATP-binding protein